MDAMILSQMRTAGRKLEIQAILADYFASHFERRDAAALAEGLRALLDLDPVQAVAIWNQLRSLPGFVEACGPGLVWKIHRLDPSSGAWDRSSWRNLPSWIPSTDDAEARSAKAPEVRESRETGNGELVDFLFLLRCPWCDREHEFTVRRTLVFRRSYSCPFCDGPLTVDGRDLRRQIPPGGDPEAVLRFENRLHSLWRDLHRAQGGHPPEAESLCQAFTTHLTRVASATLSKQGR